MKYTTIVDISLPRQRVIELFDDPANMHKWQPSMKKVELISGEPRQVGAKSKLVHTMGKREMIMIETVTDKNLPDSMHGTYETPGVKNIMENYFEELDENTTRWKTISDFRFSGVYKLMGWIMPGAFKKQTLKTMRQFKEFAEREGSTN